MKYFCGILAILMLTSVFMFTKKPEENIADKRFGQMFNTIVKIITPGFFGSGVIVNKDNNSFQALTNFHVIEESLHRIHAVDGISGEISYCRPTVWVQIGQDYYDATIIAFEPWIDLALIEFQSDKNLPVAKLAQSKLLMDIGIFDDIYSVSCQFGRDPVVYKGIICGYAINKDVLMIVTSAPTGPGSSGGGIFAQYDDAYYLIGIICQIQKDKNDFLYPHYSMSIIANIINNFMCKYSSETEGLYCHAE